MISVTAERKLLQLDEADRECCLLLLLTLLDLQDTATSLVRPSTNETVRNLKYIYMLNRLIPSLTNF